MTKHSLASLSWAISIFCFMFTDQRLLGGKSKTLSSRKTNMFVFIKSFIDMSDKNKLTLLSGAFPDFYYMFTHQRTTF